MKDEHRGHNPHVHYSLSLHYRPRYCQEKAYQMRTKPIRAGWPPTPGHRLAQAIGGPRCRPHPSLRLQYGEQQEPVVPVVTEAKSVCAINIT